MAKQKVLTLSKNKKSWVGKRDINLKGKPLHASVGLRVAYYKKMVRLLDVMSKDYEREITKAFKGEAAAGFAQDASLTSIARIVMNKLSRKYDKLFAEHAKGYADYMIRQSMKHSRTTTGASLKQLSGGLTINTDLVMSGDLGDKVKAAVLENTDLIKSLKSEYSEKIRGDVLRSITDPDSGGLKGLQERIHDALSTRYKQQKNRAKNIAFDQTRKVYGALNIERMKSAGVTKFIWNHSSGSQRPRKLHLAMDGNIYSIDDLPIIDERTGERGIPGQSIHCGCFATPIISFDDGEEV